MSSKREKVLGLAHRIMTMRTELERLEAELDQILESSVKDEQLWWASTVAKHVEGASHKSGASPGKENSSQAAALNVGDELAREHERVRMVRITRSQEHARLAEHVARAELVPQVELDAATQNTLGKRALILLNQFKPRALEIRDVASRLVADPNTTRTVLWRLEKAGEVVKVSKGVYRVKLPGETVVPKVDSDDLEQEASE